MQSESLFPSPPHMGTGGRKRDNAGRQGGEGPGGRLGQYPDMVVRFKTFPHEQSSCWQPPTSVEFRLLL